MHVIGKRWSSECLPNPYVVYVGCHYRAQSGLEPVALLHQSSNCWDCAYVPRVLANTLRL